MIYLIFFASLLSSFILSVWAIAHGSANFNGSFFVVDGRDAKWGDAFYQVSLRRISEDKLFGRGHACGGVLVKPYLVLTAAQCVFE